MDTLENILEEKFKQLYNLSKDDEQRLAQLKVISTGSLSLDASLGKGGLPRGKISLLFGKEGSGKTHIALETARNAVVKEHLNVLYLDPETGLDQELVEEFFNGYDYTIEGNVLHYTLTCGGNYLKVMKTESFEDGMSIFEEAIRSGSVGMIVVDSISAGSPDAELENELTKDTMTQQSRLLAKVCRRNMFKIIRNEVAVIVISQVRDKIGSYVPVTEPTGGRAIRHFASIEIRMEAQLGKDGLITQGEIPIGFYCKFTIIKNKLASPFRSFLIPILFGKGIDELRDFVTFAKHLGVIQKRGGYLVYEGETIGQGLVKTMQALKENQEMLDKIRKTCYDILDQGAIVTEDDDEDNND